MRSETEIKGLPPISELVLYKNNQFIAFNKPSGMPAQPDPTKTISVWQMAEVYTKSPLNLVHRLDRPVSGVLLFAKNGQAQNHVQTQMRNKSVEKTYLAIVPKNLPAQEGTLTNYLLKDGKKNTSRVVSEAGKGVKEAVLSYKVIDSLDHYHLLEIHLQTGRHHQIRVQLAHIGCPIKGDTKYGAKRSNPDQSISLHAWKLAFSHPISNDRVHVMAPPPKTDIWRQFSVFKSDTEEE